MYTWYNSSEMYTSHFHISYFIFQSKRNNLRMTMATSVYILDNMSKCSPLPIYISLESHQYHTPSLVRRTRQEKEINYYTSFNLAIIIKKISGGDRSRFSQVQFYENYFHQKIKVKKINSAYRSLWV